MSHKFMFWLRIILSSYLYCNNEATDSAQAIHQKKNQILKGATALIVT